MLRGGPVPGSAPARDAAPRVRDARRVPVLIADSAFLRSPALLLIDWNYSSMCIFCVGAPSRHRASPAEYVYPLARNGLPLPGLELQTAVSDLSFTCKECLPVSNTTIRLQCCDNDTT